MTGIVFPARTEELTPDLLTAALGEQNPDVVVTELRVAEEAHCDTGSASTAARAVLDLVYAPECDAGLPQRVVLKTVLIRPGAPNSLYKNEVRFYRDVRPELEIETPKAYASIFDDASGTFGVIMEDVRLRSARFPNATQSLDRAEIENLLEQLAHLHARFWQSPRFEGELAWLWTPCSGDFYDFLKHAGRGFIEQLVEQSSIKRAILARLGRRFDDLWSDLWKAQEILATEPTTLLHGDTHVGNTYRLPGSRVGLLDWQLMQRGRWSHDVTYLLMTSLDTAFRREHERELLAHYLDALRSAGVSAPPSPEEAWLLYRQTAIWGFLIGWMICPTANYGEAILRANLERLAAGLDDLETADALEVG